MAEFRTYVKRIALKTCLKFDSILNMLKNISVKQILQINVINKFTLDNVQICKRLFGFFFSNLFNLISI